MDILLYCSCAILCIGLPLLAVWVIGLLALSSALYCDITEASDIIWYKKPKGKPNIPKSLEPMLNAPNNRDFVIEMLKLRKETFKKYGYDPFCSVETADEIVAAEKVAAALEFLVNKYPDPDGFNRALTSTGLISYVTKFNTNKEN